MRMIVAEPETKSELLVYLESNNLKISSEAERKNDESLHWALLKDLKLSNKDKKEKIQILLCEVSLR